ncbi:MAG: tRNA (N(6)-L-threonylcarbamoyladenosine(37)-C(2))-methylthiotransferase MtaB [Rhodobacteraceae bacterium]|nr:tRNA (N(6)-L-threonylcarbamoyladenosine(37)-C(2))-methylthiotransferase MtaB [Paracoccaceae bacterium]
MNRSPPSFTTFGCRLNAAESEVMQRLARQAGLQGVAVVNSCAVTAEAMRKARGEIRRLHRANPRRAVVVTGCAAQISPQAFAAMPEVSGVLGNTEKMQLRSWQALKDRLGAGTPPKRAQLMVADIMAAASGAPLPPAPLIGRPSTRSRACVQVQNGCDHRCTFCIIPYGRGNSRSVAAGDVVRQVRHLVERGVNEVVLTGVDLTSWGGDFPAGGATQAKQTLGALVGRILQEVPELPRLRLSSLDPIETDLALLEAMAHEPRLMPHLHLSLQAGDDMILRRMKRRHRRQDAVDFCAQLRRLRPEITFGADMIAGFPTESEPMFENSLRLIEDCGLTWLHVFPYSARAGTPAARMPQVGGAVIKRRAARLRAAGAAAVARHLAAQVGRVHRVLVETPLSGRTEQFARVRFAAPRPVGGDCGGPWGGIVRAEITGCEGEYLLAETGAEADQPPSCLPVP